LTRTRTRTARSSSPSPGGWPAPDAILHLPNHAPWAALLLQAITGLRALTAPG
jgi:hypothetical protein